MPDVTDAAHQDLVEPQARIAAIRNKLKRRCWIRHLIG
jgi:hypothetical protein